MQIPRQCLGNLSYLILPEDNEQIFASKYQTILPSKDELKQLIEEEE